MKQPHGSVLPASPTAGDSCFLSDGTLHFCFVDGVWVQISGGGGGSTQEYGSFCCCRAEESWLISGFPEYVGYHAADIYWNSATYQDCYWDILEISDGGVAQNQWLRQKFASQADIYIFIRANFEESLSNPNTPRYHAYLRVYDVVGTSVPNIDKIYGMNLFYSMLRGKKNYRKNKKCIENEPSWNDFQSWFDDLCNHNMGFGPGHTYSSNDEKALWLSRTDAKRYGLPVPGFSSQVTTPGSRYAWDWGSSDFLSLPTPTTYINTPSPSGLRMTWCGLYTQMLSVWDWQDSVGNLLATFGGFNMSWLALYHLQSNADPNHRAIFVKPMGIDKVGLNWFDETAYDLYALYTRKNTTPVIRKIIIGSTRRSVARDLIWIDITKWRPVNWGYGKPRLTTKMVGLQPYTTQFFLRDQVTGDISPVSKARIVLSQRHRDAPFKFEVKR